MPRWTAGGYVHGGRSTRPVSVVTGFLGSGKTTLLGRVLSEPSMSNTAVLVNEFGEVGLDHHLLRRVDERTVLLGGGCVCCTTREDLVEALLELLDLDQRGEIPRLDRVVVETTGLADPAPI
jgi:G3E family GTPase